MPGVQFKISARTAKLIGRENFSNPEGAIIELVKNSYDADAKNCLVVFDIVHDAVPDKISLSDLKSFATEYPIFKSAYKLQGKEYCLTTAIKPSHFEILQDFFFSKNSIYIIDNGQGMTQEVVENQWMEIGTNSKELEATSSEGRILTGAKGIGRFALDRLGYLSEMVTIAKNAKTGSSWIMDWKQFDGAKKNLSDISAEVDEITLDLKKHLQSLFKGKTRLLTEINKINFQHGTIIKISNVKDNWFQSSQESVFKSLEALVPPKELQIPFKVGFYSLDDMRLYGDVETAFFNDFDYKIDAQFNSKALDVELRVTRNELDARQVKSKFAYIFKNSKYPYDLKTLSEKTFELSPKVFELLKWEKDNTNVKLLKQLGNFSFTFYYLKNTKSSDYPYREFSVGERQKVLKKFGGIKIYRDSFRVRPYGDIGNDWLKLGERAAQSPAGAGQRIGDWRVGPNQVAGLVKISRVDNPSLIDKSDRGALIENESFNTLKSIITGIVNYFEVDRSVILNPFYVETKKKDKESRDQQIATEAAKLADKIIQERTKVEAKLYGSRPDLFKEIKNTQEKEVYKSIIESGIRNIDKRDDEDAELAQIRTLASLGIIVTSFAHELKEIRNNLDELDKLSTIFTRLVPDSLKQKTDFTDGLDIFELLKEDNLKISYWVNYSLNAIKRDKRKRSPLSFEKYFSGLSSIWSALLDERKITLDIRGNNKYNYLFRCFEMDMNTIFNNLISNSIDSFNRLKVIRKRTIAINYKLIAGKMRIIYSDNGAGLSKIFAKNVDEIFLPFVTAKKDKQGNDVGTGLGMYLLKTVVDDYNGTVSIIKSTIGFKIQMEFPIKKRKI